MNDTHENFGFVLSSVTQDWRQEVDRQLRPLGLSQATWRTLVHLRRLGDGLTQSRLAASIGIEGPSLVRLLDQLEESGLVERRASPEDRRCKQLFLTDKGRAELDAILTISGGVRAALLAGLSEEQLNSTMTVLRHISDNVRKLADLPLESL